MIINKIMRYLFFALISTLLLTGCGHNMLVDYKVKGLDLSVPLFGYPFGIRLGEVTMNSNVIRGNSTYSAHSNTGFDVSTATTTTTNVIQFSANSQINEGYVKDILTSETVEPDVKQTFVENYLSNQEAPEVFPVTLKTNQGTTAAGDDPELHKSEVPKHKNLLEMFSLSSWFDNILVRIRRLVCAFKGWTTYHLISKASRRIDSIPIYMGHS